MRLLSAVATVLVLVGALAWIATRDRAPEQPLRRPAITGEAATAPEKTGELPATYYFSGPALTKPALVPDRDTRREWAGRTTASLRSLETLLPVESELPEGCAILEVDEEAPSFLERNPQVSSDPNFVRQVALELFGGDVDPTDIEEALFAVYVETAEIGAFAFRFYDEHAAQRAVQSLDLSEEAEDDDQGRILTSGNTVALIWHDGCTDACFRQLTDHIEQTIGTLH